MVQGANQGVWTSFSGQAPGSRWKFANRGVTCSNLCFSKMNLLPDFEKKLRGSWRPVGRLFIGAQVRGKEVLEWKEESGKDVRTIMGVEWREHVIFLDDRTGRHWGWAPRQWADGQ